MMLKIPFNGTIFKNLVDIICFHQKDEKKVQNKENNRHDYHPSQTGFLAFHVHKRPYNIVGLYDGQDDKDPV